MIIKTSTGTKVTGTLTRDPEMKETKSLSLMYIPTQTVYISQTLFPAFNQNHPTL